MAICCRAVLGMYAFLSLLMDGPASLATSMVGLRIAPHFDQPYLSSSIADFWSRRWNLTAGNALRFLVQPYPVCHCALAVAAHITRNGYTVPRRLWEP